jgi:4-amino-4-deoxy-L-arabinose transferase-like glycosyltransferase
MARPAASGNAPVPTPRIVHFARLALLALAAVILAASAWWRPIDGDEGYYAAAAGLTAGGAAPYADYFYPQAPALPWLYAAVVKLGGPDLRLLRAFSALLAFGAVLVWARHLARSCRREPWLGVAALALLVAAPGVVSWSVTVKTYAATGLLVSIALLALRRGVEPGARAGWLPAAGAVLGLAGSVRLFFVPLAPVLALGLVAWPGDGGRRRAAAGAIGLLAGFALGSLPLLVALLRDPAVFVFDNLGYHALRFSELRELHPDPSLPVRIGAAVTGAARVVATNPYLLGFLILAGAGLGTIRTAAGADRRYLALVGLATGVFLLGCMAPDPVYDQYFTAPLPTLALPLAAAGLARLTRARPRLLAAAVGGAAVLAALVLGLQRPGTDPDPVWSFASYERVVREIRERSAPGDVVFSFWPGYVFGADRRHFPGMENQFALGVSEKLTPAEKTRYHIADRRRLMDGFRLRTPRLVVLGTWMNEVNTALDDDQMRELLIVFQGEYEIVAMHGAVKICAPKLGR